MTSDQRPLVLSSPANLEDEEVAVGERVPSGHFREHRCHPAVLRAKEQMQLQWH